MSRAYSQDLRDRVIDAVEIGGERRRSAARRFGVIESTAVRWLQRIKHFGDRRCAGTGGHRPSKVKPERVWFLAGGAGHHFGSFERAFVGRARREGGHRHAVAVFQGGRHQLQKNRAARRAGAA